MEFYQKEIKKTSILTRSNPAPLISSNLQLSPGFLFLASKFLVQKVTKLLISAGRANEV